MAKPKTAKKKTPAKKAAKAAKPVTTKPKPAKSGVAARSVSNGGKVPFERYAKDPKSVAARIKEKVIGLIGQAANATVRAEKNNVTHAAVGKLQAAMEHLEAAKKALA